MAGEEDSDNSADETVRYLLQQEILLWQSMQDAIQTK